MNKTQLIPKYCPACGEPLETQVCDNRACRNFGVKINVAIGKKELALGSSDTAFVANNRQLAILVDSMTADAPIDYWQQLAQTSHRQLVYLSEVCQNLSTIEKALRSQPNNKEHVLTSLNKLAAIVERRANFACIMNQKSSKVVQATLELQAAQDRLQSDYRKLQSIEQQEAKQQWA